MSKRLKMLEDMIAKGSDDPFVWYARAMEFRTNEKEKALALFEEVAERFPDYVPTYLIAGQVADELGNTPTATKLLEAGIQKADEQGNDHAKSELSAALADVG